MTDTTNTETVTEVEILFGVCERPTANGTMYAPYIQLVTPSGTVFNFDCDRGYKERTMAQARANVIGILLLDGERTFDTGAL